MARQVRLGKGKGKTSQVGWGKQKTSYRTHGKTGQEDKKRAEGWSGDVQRNDG